jgi:hypothetical protein
MSENDEKKPIHESIVGLIEEADPAELKLYGRVLFRTSIPRGHDEILKAWRRRRAELSLMPERDSEGVTASLLQQKKEAEKKAAEKAEQQKRAEEEAQKKFEKVRMGS